MNKYPKRLIEVDLPIRRISAHARREKSIRHGHISTLHIWWARRPLAACRAMICASLWPDPADDNCPKKFKNTARELMLEWANRNLKLVTSQESLNRFIQIKNSPDKLSDGIFLRLALLDFIADYANWDNSVVKEYLETSRKLTQAAHEAMGGEPGTKPLVIDPFAGGGAIPLEALRLGADAFASDLNPVAVLLNKVILDYVPRYGYKLAEEVSKWGESIKKAAEKELAEFYPRNSDGAATIAYLWARTIQCEGPGCGAQIPLVRSLWLAKKSSHSVALQIIPNNKKRIDFKIIVKQHDGWVEQNNLHMKIINPKFEGTIKRGSATCPCCGFTTPVSRVREQLKARKGGTHDARLICLVSINDSEQGRQFRLPTEKDYEPVRKAAARLRYEEQNRSSDLTLLPNEPVNPLPHSVNRLPLYGMASWGDVFTQRQALALATYARLVNQIGMATDSKSANGINQAVQVCLALVLDRVADRCSSLCRYDPSPTMSGINNTFARQALPMVWDFGEGDPTSKRSGGWDQCMGWLVSVLEQEAKSSCSVATIETASAIALPLPDGSAQAFITDPPYYDMISYADLSDFFYVWLKRSLHGTHVGLSRDVTTPKVEEIIVEPTYVSGIGVKDENFYLQKMGLALSEGRRVLQPSGICVVVFAHKSTTGWESLLGALLQAGWIITGSWPIDTEMATKVAGIGQARLMSSVHLVCRPRSTFANALHSDQIGDWRDVLQELPLRIHDWMPRLAAEGVVGADAIFACLGPALEIFSRYTRVEKASGEPVSLRDYLEQVWAAVAMEALNMIFAGMDARGFEEDARLTAMWLWTLSTGNNGSDGKASNEERENEDLEVEKKVKPLAGYILEYDSARKIAQGLGAHLDRLRFLVEVKGEIARLLPVSERALYLFGKDSGQVSAKRRKGNEQPGLFELFDQEDSDASNWQIETTAKIVGTVLDRLHQSMILFAAGRNEALKRFLVEEGVGKDQRFWRLAQALSALYPHGSDEKRWVDGVLAGKKRMGL